MPSTSVFVKDMVVGQSYSKERNGENPKLLVEKVMGGDSKSTGMKSDPFFWLTFNGMSRIDKDALDTYNHVTEGGKSRRNRKSKKSRKSKSRKGKSRKSNRRR